MMDKIRNILSGLAGFKSKSFEENNVEIWEMPYYKLKVVWNKKEFDIFYEDKSAIGNISRVAHEFKNGKVELSLVEFYDMMKEASEGLQNSNLAAIGNNYTEQDIRDSKELSILLMNNIDKLLDFVYVNEDESGDIKDLDKNEIYLLIKIDEDGTYHIEGFTVDGMKARKYINQKSFQQVYNKKEYPKYIYQVVNKYE